MTETVGDALKLSKETRTALAKAKSYLDQLTDAGIRKPAILGELIEPTLRIKANLEREIVELEAIIKRLRL